MKKNFQVRDPKRKFLIAGLICTLIFLSLLILFILFQFDLKAGAAEEESIGLMTIEKGIISVVITEKACDDLVQLWFFINTSEKMTEFVGFPMRRVNRTEFRLPKPKIPGYGFIFFIKSKKHLGNGPVSIGLSPTTKPVPIIRI